MRILIATDAFPPLCGGSGWSTYELARGLRARGHEIVIVRPLVDTLAARPPAWVRLTAKSDPRLDAARKGFGSSDAAEYDGFRPIVFPAWAPPVPYVRNYCKNERLYPRFDRFLRRLIREQQIDLVHAQHVLTSPPAIAAARAAGVTVVCTVRDYWPVCYWADLIYNRSADTLCPGCCAAMMTRCVRPRAGVLWPLALPMIPYMRANLAAKRRSLAAADAIVAVGSTLARDLRARAPELHSTRIEVIPNPVDVAGIRTAAEGARRPMASPYALYVGKLAPNKGVRKLIDALARARLDWPLVVVGDGPERAVLEAAARTAGLDVRFTGWLPREEVLGWMCHAAILVFPSRGPESLSRVLLEACALGLPVAAMETGGTGDIIVHEKTGLLSRAAERLGDDVARLRHDEALRRRLGEGARRRVERLFDAAAVVSRLEALYDELRRTRTAAPRSGGWRA